MIMVAASNIVGRLTLSPAMYIPSLLKLRTIARMAKGMQSAMTIRNQIGIHSL